MPTIASQIIAGRNIANTAKKSKSVQKSIAVSANTVVRLVPVKGLPENYFTKEYESLALSLLEELDRDDSDKCGPITDSH